MKRSEALKLIDDEYDKFVKDWLSLDIGDDNEISKFVPLNERILKALENIGMLPPYTKLTTLKIADNTWEPEDER
jgi:hypothetical protein